MPDKHADDRLVWALRHAFFAVEAAKDDSMRSLDVTPSQYGVLIATWFSPGITNAELARRLHVSPQNASVLVTALESRDLIKRRPHPQHAHVREIHLTEQGLRALDEADKSVARVEKAITRALGRETSTSIKDALDQITSVFPRRT